MSFSVTHYLYTLILSPRRHDTLSNNPRLSLSVAKIRRIFVDPPSMLASVATISRRPYNDKVQNNVSIRDRVYYSWIVRLGRVQI